MQTSWTPTWEGHREMLKARDICSGYGRVPVLHGIDFDVSEGELVAVVGPNGAGKSTLMKTLARVLPLMSGSIDFHGATGSGWRAPDAVAAGIAFVPQDQNVFPTLSVIDNLRISARSGRGGPSLDEVLARLPQLADRTNQRAGTLSGGERQMLAIASALLMGGDLLLLDEPTTGLAPIIVDQLTEWIAEISAAGHSVVWVLEQDPERVLGMADRAYVVEGGRISREGEPSTIAADYIQDILTIN